MIEPKMPRLLAAAKEFNIGQDTLVEFLVRKGFPREELKLAAKVSLEMYTLLQEEFKERKEAKIKEDVLTIVSQRSVTNENIKKAEDEKRETISRHSKTAANEMDVEIYKHISNQMDVTEIYLGHILFPFYYTKAQYTATCTEAFPFNPFDKVICELLKVEEQLTFENIGDILGMNVYESENPKRYLDLAEKEILTEALQSLASEEFRMITIGDINFSSCRLTQIGREYAEKKSKYRVTENKPFLIYFDHTTGNHIQAKQFYEFADGKISTKQFAIELADESALKEIAAVQIPEIYNPAKQYSFTDAVLKRQQNLQIEFPVAITFNTKVNSYRFYCYDTANKTIHKHFNEWINNNESVKYDLLEDFSATETEANQKNYAAIYLEQVSAFEPNTKINIVIHPLLKQQFIDEQLFLSSFNLLFNSTEKVELYLCLPTISDNIYKTISSIIQNSENEDSRFYFAFPNQLNERIIKSFKQLQGISNSVKNLYVMQLQVKSFLLLCKTESESFYFEIANGSVNNHPKNFFERKIWNKWADKIELHFLERFSDEYALKVCDKVTKVVSDNLQESVSKQQLDELKFYEFKLEPFANIGTQGETVELTLELIENFRHDRIEKLEEKLNSQLDEIETRLSTVTDEKEFAEIQKHFAATTSEIIFDDSEAFERSEALKPIIASKKEEFAEAQKVYNLIFDTNVLLNHPDIFTKVARKNNIIIAARVLNELDNHKANPEHKEAAAKCIREIHSDKNKNIHKVKANPKLLPIDFKKGDPDNIILSSALIYQGKNGILITDDKGFFEKAKTVEMPVMTYDDFITNFVNTKK